MTIRKAIPADIPAVSTIYDAIHTAEEAGLAIIGWVRGVYPTQATANAALVRGDLFVLEDGGRITGAAIINQSQCDGYETANWQYPAADSEIMVLHTLVIDPAAARRGYGKAFVSFYESYARKQGCCYLRMDTNVRNARARAMYEKLGYREIGVIPTTFNGIAGVNLVLLEKALEREMMNEAFWQMLDQLVSESRIVIDRPKGSAHPRYPEMIYPLDYGYLKNSTSMDGEGIDVWIGTDPQRKIDAIVCTVDMMKHDSEIKLLIGCTEEQKQIVLAVHNDSPGMKGILVCRKEKTV